MVLLECLWHEAARMLVEQPAMLHTLPGAAAEFAGTFINTAIYDPDEFALFLQRRMRGDEELQLALRDSVGLFDSVIDAVLSAISDGAR